MKLMSKSMRIYDTNKIRCTKFFLIERKKNYKKYNGASWELNPGPLACFVFLCLNR